MQPVAAPLSPQCDPNGIEKGLGDKDTFVRLAAIRFAGEVGPQASAAAPALRAAQQVRHPEVRQQAAVALKKVERQ